jgi:alanyl-tRNA synthetase
MATERLYYDAPLLCDFEAEVIAPASFEGRPSVLLDRTAFYPESGGQMADRGRLGGAAVLDVQVDEQNQVHHLVEGPLPAVGSVVSGAIDRARRRLHMALHSGQHVLSRALLDVAGAETVSSRLGESVCTIDVDSPDLGDAVLGRVEDLANAVVDGDVPIRAFVVPPVEIKRFALRRPPKVEGDVRLIEIEGFDVTPCGGTHCTHSAQIGVIRVLGVERYKGGTRVTFDSGRRARARLSRESELLRELGRGMSCGPDDVPQGIDKLRRQLAETREALGQARAHLANRAADELLRQAESNGRRHLVAELEGVGPDVLRAIATRLTARVDAVALLAAPGVDGVAVLVARGTESSFDCGAFLRRTAQACGGRGGGRPERAEGRLPAGVSWTALVSSLIEGA